MSCENCDKYQDTGQGYYIRIGNGNVYVQACEKHFRELKGMVRAYTKGEEQKGTMQRSITDKW